MSFRAGRPVGLAILLALAALSLGACGAGGDETGGASPTPRQVPTQTHGPTPSPEAEPELPGGSNGGRSLAPEPFDGRRLGKRFDALRPPLASMMLLGGMMVGRTDLPHLYNMLRAPKSAWHAARMFGRYGRDRLRWKRGSPHSVDTWHSGSWRSYIRRK